MRLGTRLRLRILWFATLAAGVALLGAEACGLGAADDGRSGGVTGGAGGAGGSVDCASSCPEEAPTAASVQSGPTTGSAVATSSSGAPPATGGQNACATEPPGPAVVRAPDNPRTYDSAIYAHTLLAHGKLPSADSIRLADFINYEGYSAPYDPSHPNQNASVDLSFDTTTSDGVLVARLVTPPASAPPSSLGMVIVLDTAPSTIPVRDVELAAADVLVKKLAAGSGNAVVLRTWSSAPLGDLQTAPQLIADARAGNHPLPVDSLNGLSAMLESAGVQATHMPLPGDAPRHVVVFTDGGASTSNLASVLSGYKQHGIELDVIEVATEASLESAPYDTALLDTLTTHGGARFLLTDEPAPTPSMGKYRDVNDLIDTRFDDNFRDAYTENRAVLTAPQDLQPIGVPAVANPSEMGPSATPDVRGVTAGFGRTIEFRQIVKSSTPQFPLCSAALSAQFHFKAAGAAMELDAQNTVPFGVKSAAQSYDEALVEYVIALRQTAAAFPMAAKSATATVQQAQTFCAPNGTRLDSKACAALARMYQELNEQPHP